MRHNNTPEHIAFIMDGNGRWAKKRFLPRVFGHRAGAETVRRVVRLSGEAGVRFLTLYAFSSENWKRPVEEVGFLFGLFKSYMTKEIDALDADNVRVRFIGRREGLPADVCEIMDFAVARTDKNTGLTLILAVNYGSYHEIADAVTRIVREKADYKDPVSAEEIADALQTAEYPAPDLIIRTAGERRLSNFLLWQAAYSELYFTDTLWPDFDRAQFDAALADFDKRERKYGGVIDDV